MFLCVFRNNGGKWGKTMKKIGRHKEFVYLCTYKVLILNNKNTIREYIARQFITGINS